MYMYLFLECVFTNNFGRCRVEPFKLQLEQGTNLGWPAESKNKDKQTPKTLLLCSAFLSTFLDHIYCTTSTTLM